MAGRLLALGRPEIRGGKLPTERRAGGRGCTIMPERVPFPTRFGKYRKQCANNVLCAVDKRQYCIVFLTIIRLPVCNQTGLEWHPDRSPRSYGCHYDLPPILGQERTPYSNITVWSGSSAPRLSSIHHANIALPDDQSTVVPCFAAHSWLSCVLFCLAIAVRSNALRYCASYLGHLKNCRFLSPFGHPIHPNLLKPSSYSEQYCKP